MIARFALLLTIMASCALADEPDLKTWPAKREKIVQGMQAIMGKLPASDRRVALNVTVEDEADAGSYIRRLITFQSEPGSRTPAYLCIPKKVLAGERRAKGVLCLHPTDNTVGHKVVVGLGGRERRAYAAELAERGLVTIAPAYPHLANYTPDLKKLNYESGTMKAIWDNTRALDLLDSLEYVDNTNGYGVIGHSLGGHNAIFTAVLEPRISVIVTSCGFDAFPDYYDGSEKNWYFGKGWCQTRYMPRLANYRGRLEEIPFDFPKLLSALAPRPVFINAPLHDSNFRHKSVDKCVKAATPIYELYNATEKLIVRHPDCDHNFPEELRVEAYKVIADALK